MLASDSAWLALQVGHVCWYLRTVTWPLRTHANAKGIVAHIPVIDLASQDGARNRAAAKRACVGYALLSSCCWCSGCRWWIAQRFCGWRVRMEIYAGVGGRGQPLNSAPLAPHEWPPPRASQSDYRALWWGAPQAADPPTPGPEKHQKSFTPPKKKNFLDGIRVAHKRFQEHFPLPPFWGHLKSEKMPFWHIFGPTLFSFSKLTKCCKLQHGCVLTSFAGAMQKCRKCCKYHYFLDQRRTKHHKTLQIQVFLKAKQKKTL